MVGSLFLECCVGKYNIHAGEIKIKKYSVEFILRPSIVIILIFSQTWLTYLFFRLPEIRRKGCYESGIQFAAEDRVGTAVAHLIFGEPAAIIMAILIMVSTFGATTV